MSVGIVGAGFAGLAAAYYLSSFFRVVIFDKSGIGSGASGIAAGLLHPYPGKEGRRNWRADEAMVAARELISVSERAGGKIVALKNGITKVGKIQGIHDDIKINNDGSILIKSGITVFPDLYLKGLLKACEERGAKLILHSIANLNELASFDYIILAVGAGIVSFYKENSLKLRFVKGQVLTCSLITPLERSVIKKQYKAVALHPSYYHLGATYEREKINDIPCLTTAIATLQPDTPVLDCRAAIRVRNSTHYLPIIEKMNPKTWAITALGSRGLLYHAYLGKAITQRLQILQDFGVDQCQNPILWP